ncbi:carbohydrate ABC transporter permease [Aestuariispira insulae]|uniref:Maltose/maltodextrin transport system permease protein MalG n=1 Tax=Aestuariispira insulae TaxID=1461337 RepID=A0A3D9H9D6_9PROT|nr:carbohydrate ABC transporter permease [Aestuariispira insulae]RED46103.1 carbohydrate ABC transporter membrane protein 2 (CUT1 family) [Aestuariispira insulae]
MTRRSPSQTIMIYSLALLLGAVLLAPVLWLFIMSVSSTRDLTALPLTWIPETISLENYAKLLGGGGSTVAESFLTALRNSLIVALSATAISLAVAVPAAYSFSRLPGRRRKSLLFVAIATFMMPPVAIVLPLYAMMGELGLLNTHLSLILVYCGILVPFTTWLLKSNFDGIPMDLDEAPIIDGANRLQVIWHVTLPIAKPALGAAALMAVLMAWDEFFYALLFTNDIRAKTLPVAIADFAAGRVADYGLISAAGILATIPPVALAYFLQKSLVSGLMSGSVKG